LASKIFPFDFPECVIFFPTTTKTLKKLDNIVVVVVVKHKKLLQVKYIYTYIKYKKS